MPMKILVATTGFKGSLSALEACHAIAKGIQQSLPQTFIAVTPVSDGGDGLLEALQEALPPDQIRAITTYAVGPLGVKVKTQFLILKRGRKKVAVIETAKVCGLAMVPANKRKPMLATSYGLGELMGQALQNGAASIYVGLGGTATSDGGAGMAQALGGKLLDSRGHPIGFGAQALASIVRMDVSDIKARFRGVKVFGLSDVNNPLLGPSGTAKIYAPQKGATKKQVERIERYMTSFAQVIERDLKIRVAHRPAAGSAGGLGAGLIAFCGAQLAPGISTVLRLIQAEAAIRQADIVVVGEGRLDASTLSGKAPQGVAQMAQRYGKKVVGVFGSIAADPPGLPERMGLAAVRTLLQETSRPHAAIQQAAFLLAKASRNLFLNYNRL